MKNNGFTLIELLGVIIILALLMLLIFPSIINNIKSSNDKVEANVNNLIRNASELHVNNNLDEYIKSSKNTYCISIGDLITEDYLDEDIVNSSKNVTLDWKVKVNYDETSDNFSYTISRTCKESYVCSLNDVDNSGDINLSDIVTCGSENFYVMENDGINITMLSEYRIRNINNEMKQDPNDTNTNAACLEIFSTIPYWLEPNDNDEYTCKDASYENVLSKYKLVGDQEYPYVFDRNVESEKLGDTDTVVYRVIEYNKYLKKIGIVTASTTLMSYEQAIDLECNYVYNEEKDQGTCEQAPSWVYSTSYFLGSYDCVTMGNEEKIRIWSIDLDKTFDRPEYNRGGTYHGVRPVVIMSKQEIKIKR